MSVTCECGEQVRDGQTFCRQCGKRAGGPRKSQDHTRELTRVRSAPPPQPHHPPPPPSGRGGPDPKVIFAGAFAVLALAGGAYAFTTLDSGSNGGGVGGGEGKGKEERALPKLLDYREKCGNDVYAAGSASCPFSRNVAAQYRDAPSKILYDVYSPETEMTYNVRCKGSNLIKCTGGVAAEVYFYP